MENIIQNGGIILISKKVIYLSRLIFAEMMLVALIFSGQLSRAEGAGEGDKFKFASGIEKWKLFDNPKGMLEDIVIKGSRTRFSDSEKAEIVQILLAVNSAAQGKRVDVKADSEIIAAARAAFPGIDWNGLIHDNKVDLSSLEKPLLANSQPHRKSDIAAGIVGSDLSGEVSIVTIRSPQEISEDVVITPGITREDQEKTFNITALPLVASKSLKVQVIRRTGGIFIQCSLKSVETQDANFSNLTRDLSFGLLRDGFLLGPISITEPIIGTSLVAGPFDERVVRKWLAK